MALISREPLGVVGAVVPGIFPQTWRHGNALQHWR